MKKLFLLFALLSVMISTDAQNTCKGGRRMWASINNIKNASLGGYQTHTGKLLLSWRMLPSDKWDTSFLIYSRLKTGGALTKVTASPVVSSTCHQLAAVPTATTIYYLVRGDIANAPQSIESASEIQSFINTYALDQIEVGERLFADKLPYLSIPLKGTSDVCSSSTIVYQANDVSVGDLDGDGEPEIVVKRLQTVLDGNGNVISDGTGASQTQKSTIHAVIWDAYKLNGTLLWRIKGGPAVMLGNGTAFAVADFDGDGRCEMAIRTGEGTVFGDGTQIGDVNGDGKTDYRTWTGGYVDNYNSGGPEFLSIIDGKTGKELARTNFINRDTSESWGDNYWKRSNSFRIGAGCFDSTGLPSVVMGRGVYARSVIEAWDYRNGKLTRRWHIDTSDSWTGKDGNPSSTYAGQGNHSFNVADLDGDGYDEVMYGSMAIDHDGKGLWTTKLGHGDANHVGKFLPGRDGLQMYHCLESGKTQVALHDAKDGKVIWKKEWTADNDMGRCLVADIDPNSPGCEFWMYGSNAFSYQGTDLGYKPSSCNMAIWFDGTLSRQLLNENIIDSPANGRTFTMYRYNESFINGTKSNPSWYGDLMGDWREEVILPDQSKLVDLKIFSTWYPSDYKFPYLMSDHTYYMQTINQNIGYNQPNQLGYFLGTGMDMSKVPVGQKGYTDMPEIVTCPKPGITRTAWNESGQSVLYPTVAVSTQAFTYNGTKVTADLSAVFTSLDGKQTAVGGTCLTEDYESSVNADSWIGKYVGRTLKSGDATYGNYISLTQGGGSGPRSAYTRFFETGNDFYGEMKAYTVEFDAQLHYTHGNYTGNELVLYAEGAALPNGNAMFAGTNYLFRLSGGNNYSTTYTVDGKSFNLTDAAWYHYQIDVDKQSKKVSYTIKSGKTTIAAGSYSVAALQSLNAQGIEIGLGRKDSYASIDNVKVYQNTSISDVFTQNYESSGDASTWTGQYVGKTLVSGDASHGKYIKLDQGGGSGPRSAYTRFYTGSDIYGTATSYTIDFDLLLHYTHGYYTGNEVVLFGEGAAMPKGNAMFSSANHLFRLTGGNNYSSTYTVGGSGKAYDLTDAAWYHYQVKVDKQSKTVTYTISSGSTVVGTETYSVANAETLNIQGLEIGLGRKNSYAQIDNIKIVAEEKASLSQYTFKEPGTLTVTATYPGCVASTASYTSEIGVRVSSLGYSTLSYAQANLDFTKSGLKMYTLALNNAQSGVNATKVNAVLPKGSAVLVEGTAGQVYAGTITGTATSLSNNALTANANDLAGDGTIYVLNGKDGHMGFYQLSASGSLTAGKGYITVKAAKVKALGTDGEEEETATGILELNRAETDAQTDVWYNLAGQRVETPTKGIFINGNGKKYLFK